MVSKFGIYKVILNLQKKDISSKSKQYEKNMNI